ncbi:MAG: phage tail tape measure protein, partial [Dehalococcoidia bacterium]
ADEVGKLSERTGIAVETLSEWRHIAQQSGATIESITPGLRTLARNMQDAANGTGEALKSLKDLDIEVTNAEGGLRSMDDVMLDVADRFSGMTDGAAKAAFAQRLFGESGTALIPALNRGRDGIRELTTEAQQLGKVFTAEAAKAAADFNDAIATLRDSVTQMAREFVIDHAPAIKRIATEMANAAREGGALKGVVEGLRQAFSEMLPGGGDAVEQERRRLNMLTIELVDLEAQLQKVQGLSGFTRGLLGLPSEEALRQRIENIKAERQRLTQWLAAEDAKLEQGSVPDQKLNPTVHPSEADEKAREEARKKRLKELEAEEQARVQREADLHQRLKEIADKREMEAAQRQAEALARHRAQAEFERKTLEEEQRQAEEKQAREEREAE